METFSILDLIEQSSELARIEESLTDMDRRFVSAYVLNGFSMTKTARELNISKKQAYRMSKFPNTRLLIDFYLDIEAIASRHILRELSDIALNSSVDGLMDENGKFDLAQAKENGSLRYVKRLEISTRGGQDTIKAEMLDRVQALSMLAKASGMHHKQTRGGEWRQALEEAGVSGDVVITKVTELIVQQFYPTETDEGITSRGRTRTVYEPTGVLGKGSLLEGGEDSSGD